MRTLVLTALTALSLLSTACDLSDLNAVANGDIALQSDRGPAPPCEYPPGNDDLTLSTPAKPSASTAPSGITNRPRPALPGPSTQAFASN